MGRVPFLGDERHVVGAPVAVVDENHIAEVFFTSDQPADGLGHAVKTRPGVGVLKALSRLAVVILP